MGIFRIIVKPLIFITFILAITSSLSAEDAHSPLTKVTITSPLVGEGQGEGVVTVEGFSSMENITKEDARRLAIEDAERNAVEQVAGVTVSADTLINNFTVSSDVISAIPYGKVIEREILTEDIQVIKDETVKLLTSVSADTVT